VLCQHMRAIKDWACKYQETQCWQGLAELVAAAVVREPWSIVGGDEGGGGEKA
jgi:hypothetical protein